MKRGLRTRRDVVVVRLRVADAMLLPLSKMPSVRRPPHANQSELIEKSDESHSDMPVALRQSEKGCHCVGRIMAAQSKKPVRHAIG